MITGNFYAITALMSALVCLAIFICNNTIYERESIIRKYFSILLIHFIACNLIDCVWGLMYTKTLNAGRLGFNIVSFLIHFTIIMAVSFWCIFLTNYFGFRENRTAMILQYIPVAAALCILVTQIIGHTVFYIDDECNYYPGPYRAYLFFIQYSYYVIAFLKVVYFLAKNHKEHTVRHNLIVLECAGIPVIFGILQRHNPDAPYSTLGLMFSAILVFNGMMVIEKHRRSHVFETISKEMYMGLEALSDSFVSVILLDLEAGTDTVIKTTPYARSKVQDGMNLHDRVMTPFVTSVTGEYLEAMKKFADIDTLNERMNDRRSISMQYCSKGIGWSVVSFVAAERDETRRLKKVVLAVQSVDEAKKKEIEYQKALSRAYENENAVFAELIRMESTAVVAESDRKIIIVNDAALELFGKTGTNPIGMDVFRFWKDSPVRTSDEIKEKFLDVEENGGEFSYQTVAYTDGNEDDIRYLRGDVKRVDLLDGAHYMITCFTDITSGKLLENRLQILSETDHLTGVANRKSGESQIKILLREGIGGTFCLFNINGFKSINDASGHQTGDDVLVAVANAVRASFRSDDIIMRVGGDEFAVFIRGVVEADLAKIKIARLFENVGRIEFESIPKGSISISLGAAVANANGAPADEEYKEIYKLADTRMYECKGGTGSNMSIEGDNTES